MVFIVLDDSAPVEVDSLVLVSADPPRSADGVISLRIAT